MKLFKPFNSILKINKTEKAQLDSFKCFDLKLTHGQFEVASKLYNIVVTKVY